MRSTIDGPRGYMQLAESTDSRLAVEVLKDMAAGAPCSSATAW
jgi:hypothetical protein